MKKIIASSVLLMSIIYVCAEESEKSSPSIVKEIVIQGSKRLSVDNILKIIKTRVGDKFDKKKWDDDWWRLKKSSLLQTVSSVSCGGVPGGVVLRLYIVDAPTISSVSFENEIKIPRNTLHCMRGDPFSEITLNKDIKVLSRENGSKKITIEKHIEKYETHIIGRVEISYPSVVKLVVRFQKLQTP